jgi:hypothetical protein
MYAWTSLDRLCDVRMVPHTKHHLIADLEGPSLSLVQLRGAAWTGVTS